MMNDKHAGSNCKKKRSNLVNNREKVENWNKYVYHIINLIRIHSTMRDTKSIFTFYNKICLCQYVNVDKICMSSHNQRVFILHLHLICI